MRGKHSALGKYFQEGEDKKDFQRYYLEPDMFDPRIENLKETFKMYEGLPARQYGVAIGSRKWMTDHHLA